MLLLPRTLSPSEATELEDELRKNQQEEEWVFEASRRDLIRRIFLETADATYITARWQFFNGLYFEFYWNALHALEKYFKGALLLSGIGVKDIRHDIEEAFKKTQEVFGSDLLPDEFPPILTDRIKHIVTGDQALELRYIGPKAYVRHLQWQGGAEARYAMLSHNIYTTDLYCFDLTVFLARRLVENSRIVDRITELRNQPEMCPSRGGLLEQVFLRETHQLRPVLEKVNYYLVPCPDTSKALKVSGIAAFSNSAIYNHIVENSSSSSATRKAVSKRLAKWVLAELPGIGPYKQDLQRYV